MLYFQSVCTMLHSQQQCRRVPVSCYYYLLLPIVLIIAILLGMEWFLIVVLVCISLMANGTGSFCIFIGLLYIFFEKMSIQVLYPFLNCIVFLLLSCRSSLYILDISHMSDIWFANISFLWLFFTSLISFVPQSF